MILVPSISHSSGDDVKLKQELHDLTGDRLLENLSKEDFCEKALPLLIDLRRSNIDAKQPSLKVFWHFIKKDKCASYTII